MSHLPRADCLCREGVRVAAAMAYRSPPGIVAMFCKCGVRKLMRNSAD